MKNNKVLISVGITAYNCSKYFHDAIRGYSRMIQLKKANRLNQYIGNNYIYLDYNATTPVNPAVFNEMGPYFSGNYGNESSLNHQYYTRVKNPVLMVVKTLLVMDTYRTWGGRFK